MIERCPIEAFASALFAWRTWIERVLAACLAFAKEPQPDRVGGQVLIPDSPRGPAAPVIPGPRPIGAHALRLIRAMPRLAGATSAQNPP